MNLGKDINLNTHFKESVRKKVRSRLCKKIGDLLFQINGVSEAIFTEAYSNLYKNWYLR